MILYVRVSTNVIRSSLLPTATVLPLGDQQMLMFSPRVDMTSVHRVELRESHTRMVLSPDAVTRRLELEGCQHRQSTLSLWPFIVQSLASRSFSRVNMLTVLSKEHDARSLPLQFQPTE